VEQTLISCGFARIIETSGLRGIGWGWRHGPIEIQLIPEGYTNPQTQKVQKRWKANFRGRVESWVVTFYEWGLKSSVLVGVDRATIQSKNLDKFCQMVSQMDWAGLALLLEQEEL